MKESKSKTTKKNQKLKKLSDYEKYINSLTLKDKILDKDFFKTFILDIFLGGIFSLNENPYNFDFHLSKQESLTIRIIVIVIQLIILYCSALLFSNGHYRIAILIILPYILLIIFNIFIYGIDNGRDRKSIITTIIILLIYLIIASDSSGELIRYGHHFRFRL